MKYQKLDGRNEISVTYLTFVFTHLDLRQAKYCSTSLLSYLLYLLPLSSHTVHGFRTFTDALPRAIESEISVAMLAKSLGKEVHFMQWLIDYISSLARCSCVTALACFFSGQ